MNDWEFLTALLLPTILDRTSHSVDHLQPTFAWSVIINSNHLQKYILAKSTYFFFIFISKSLGILFLCISSNFDLVKKSAFKNIFIRIKNDDKKVSILSHFSVFLGIFSNSQCKLIILF